MGCLDNVGKEKKWSNSEPESSYFKRKYWKRDKTIHKTEKFIKQDRERERERERERKIKNKKIIDWK